MRWINYNEKKPPVGVEVLAYHHLWIDSDFNPRGIRIGFLADNIASDSDNNPYDFISAHWWDYHGDYIAISKCITENNTMFSNRIKDSCEPEYWMEIPDFLEKDEKNGQEKKQQ